MSHKIGKIKKIFTQKVNLLILMPLMIFSMLATPFGFFGTLGTQNATAADPRGDFSSQYWKTRDNSVSWCYRIFNNCTNVTFNSWGNHGPNSRWFKWNLDGDGMRCVLTNYIGNNNYIFGATMWSDCVKLYKS